MLQHIQVVNASFFYEMSHKLSHTNRDDHLANSIKNNHMKHKILLLAIMILSAWTNTFSQTKVYAYAQPVVSGVSPQGIIKENGKEVKTPQRSRFNHFFFMRHNRKRDIKPVAIWMDGRAWNVKYNVVDSTPVYITNIKFPGTSEKVILVPKTRKKVLALQIDYDRPIESTPAGDLQKKIKESAIVFEYTCKGKTKYRSLEKLTLLEPVATM